MPVRLLLHTETSDGTVIPVWEEVEPDNVQVLKEIMTSRKTNPTGVELVYRRIPITAEKMPDFNDFNEIMEVVVRNDSASIPMVVNCQLGRGRSTMTAVSTICSFHCAVTTVVVGYHSTDKAMA